jgi:lipopolysaccharide export LptBFGC system permease protein LptF
MAEESKKSSGKGFLISISIILFLVNVWKFLNNPCSEIPILTILFNMIIYLAIIILIIHKKEIRFECYIQKQIEKFK